MSEPIWQPTPERVASHPLTRFANAFDARSAANQDYNALHSRTVTEPERFWSALWDFSCVVGRKGERILAGDGTMLGTRFFPDAQLNFAENLLRGHEGAGADAIVFRREDGVQLHMSWQELRERVSVLQQAMRRAGIERGDRIAVMLPNMPEAVALMLATASLGAIWASCSPDFGERGVVDRFSQIEPKLFLACDGYVYGGKRIDLSDRLASIVRHLDCRAIVVPFLGDGTGTAEAIGGETLGSFVEGLVPAEPTFERLPFDHPLYILFSSGTTGAPKCIVHRAGGILLQHLKEHRLHCGIGAGDRVFWFTTLGWMMWNWLVSALATGATLMLYDGSPFHSAKGKDPDVIFDFAHEERFTFLGTSAKFIDGQRVAGSRPIETHDLADIATIASTGSPLAPENFRYAYRSIKSDMHLASVSGGTDICACFVTAVPWEGVHAGEIQGSALAMAVEVWDDDGKPVVGRKGELVCTRPFPSMPLGFWNDPEGERYRQSYFATHPSVWSQGDYAEWIERVNGARGGMIIHGRSDATLNPGGVRIGTAEIYNIVEAMEVVDEALCIGQTWQGDIRVVLFVRLEPGRTLDAALEADIRARVRAGATPRHVPSIIIAVPDIPRTKSGKITELAVRDIVEGREVSNREALANPEALDLFRGLPELAA